MQEHFSSHTLAEVFRDLFHAERSGVLHLSRGGVEKRIYFDRGMMLYAESDAEEESLGPRLVREGKISPGALVEARRNVSESKDLPQALINRDLIGKEALSHTVRYLLEQIVRSVFTWEGGSSRFQEGWLLQELFDADVVSTFEILQKGIAGMAGFEPVGNALRDLEGKLRLRDPNPVPVEKLPLSPGHGFVLSRVDGTTRFADVLSILPSEEEGDAARFLYGLLVLGVVDLDPPLCEGPFRVASILRDHADQIAVEQAQEKTVREAYDALRNKNPFEVLGVSADAAREDIERAYEDAKSAVRRERFLPRIQERFRSELSFIESRLVEAYLALIQSRQRDVKAKAREAAATEQAKGDVTADDLLVRVEMDKTKTKVALEESTKTAEAYFAKARRAMREGDYHNAIQYGKLAISYRPEDARYFFLLAECQVRNPEARWQRMAEQNYVKATELDAWNPDYWVKLGQFYRRRGLNLRARKQIEKALAVAPGHEDAEAELKHLG